MIRLNINEEILDKVLWLLSNFKKEDLEIIQEDEDFSHNKKKLEDILERLDSGEEKFFTQEQLNSKVSQVLSKYDR